MQEQRLQAHAATRGYTVVAQISECGAASNLKCEGIQRLMQLAESKQIDVVLALNISRLSRVTTDALTLLRKLKALDVEVITLDELTMSDHRLELLEQIAGGVLHG